MNPTQDSYRGALIGAAIGDALGATVDMLSRSEVKEKFGGLRFYVKGGNERALARIDEAAQEAERICEGCGAPSSIRSLDGWLTTVCDDCRLRGR